MSYDTWKTTEPEPAQDPEDRLQQWAESCQQAQACGALEVRYQATRLLWLDEEISRLAWRITPTDAEWLDQMTDGFWSECPAHVQHMLQSLWAQKCARW